MQHDRGHVLNHADDLHPATCPRKRAVPCRRTKFAVARDLPRSYRNGHDRGAKAAHLENKIGTLTPGKEADIIMLAAQRINVFPLNNVPGTIVTLMDTSNVENVFVAGKVMKWQGKLVGI